MIQETQTPDVPPSPKPKAQAKAPRPRPDHCLNCGTLGNGNFCAHCGQENKDHTVALKPLVQDLMAEFASWDSRLLRTLKALVFRPGFLTNEYNAGRRASYVSPLKLYLTISVLFFLVLAWKNPLAGQVQVGVSPHSEAAHTMIVMNGRPEPLPHSRAEYDAYQAHLPPAQRDPPLARLFIYHAIRAGGDKQGFLAALLGGIPKMMFFLFPLFAVSLKVLYWRTKRLYVEHLIFLLHVHAFAFLLLTPLLLTHPDWLVVSAFLVLTVYILAALRVVYKQNWGKTLGKFFLLNVGYVTLLSLCLAGTALAALLLT